MNPILGEDFLFEKVFFNYCIKSIVNKISSTSCGLLWGLWVVVGEEFTLARYFKTLASPRPTYHSYYFLLIPFLLQLLVEKYFKEKAKFLREKQEFEAREREFLKLDNVFQQILMRPQPTTTTSTATSSSNVGGIFGIFNNSQTSANPWTCLLYVSTLLHYLQCNSILNIRKSFKISSECKFFTNNNPQPSNNPQLVEDILFTILLIKKLKKTFSNKKCSPKIGINILIFKFL